MDRKLLGRIGLSMAIEYFTINGYTVSLPLNDTQWYDLIIEKDGILETVQCKCTDTEDNCINLRSLGGTKGTEYDRVTNHPNLTYLFCVDRDRNLFLIPIKDIISADNKSSIFLRTEPNKNHQGFNTCKYLINKSK